MMVQEKLGYDKRFLAEVLCSIENIVVGIANMFKSEDETPAERYQVSDFLTDSDSDDEARRAHELAKKACKNITRIVFSGANSDEVIRALDGLGKAK